MDLFILGQEPSSFVLVITALILSAGIRFHHLAYTILSGIIYSFKATHVGEIYFLVQNSCIWSIRLHTWGVMTMIIFVKHGHHRSSNNYWRNQAQPNTFPIWHKYFYTCVYALCIRLGLNQIIIEFKSGERQLIRICWYILVWVRVTMLRFP